MLERAFWLSLVLCLAGCVAPPEKTEQPKEPLSFLAPYDLVWGAVVDTVESRFEIHKRDYEAGSLVTRYKEGRTFLEPWGIDSQTAYECWEESLNRVRRRCTVQLTREEESVAVEISIVRERLNYVPPPAGNETATSETNADRQEVHVRPGSTPGERWTVMGSDERLADRIGRDISERLEQLKQGRQLTEIRSL